MIFFDVTKAGSARHQSGLVRVSACLRRELGAKVTDVVWKDGEWRSPDGKSVRVEASDWLLTPELFSEDERPGFWAFLRRRQCRMAAIFHDAIPIKRPQITWPKSVSRHPEYMKMLAGFDRVFAVSRASEEELTGFWRWMGVQSSAVVQTLALGANATAAARVTGMARGREDPPLLLCVGIVEPRKNQMFLADVLERLATGGVKFRAVFVGRVNPYFGKPIAKRLRTLGRSYPQIEFKEALGDGELTGLWGEASASLFATIAEGCGLPLLESLWMGVPCVCSDLPVLRENADGGGCLALPPNDLSSWVPGVRRVLEDAAFRADLRQAAISRKLPTWAETAEALRSALV
jgi:glycosyltransferase involved in cell wall biosynthesis